MRAAPSILTALAAGALGVPAAHATAIKPGLWTLGSIQEICLVDGGTWYSPTFAGWNGRWSRISAKGDRALISGDYAPGGRAAGSDQVVVGPTRRADWTEWRDYTARVGSLAVQLDFISRACGPPAAANPASRPNPMD